MLNLSPPCSGIAIANSIFSNKLASALPLYAPDAPFELVRRSVEAIKTLPLEQQPGQSLAFSSDGFNFLTCCGSPRCHQSLRSGSEPSLHRKPCLPSTMCQCERLLTVSSPDWRRCRWFGLSFCFVHSEQVRQRQGHDGRRRLKRHMSRFLCPVPCLRFLLHASCCLHSRSSVPF